MSDYIRKLTNEFEQIATSVLKTQVTYPVGNDKNTVGFRVDKDTARKLAIQILIAAETSESIFITGERTNNTVRVARYK